jgi:hypothetical protein
MIILLVSFVTSSLKTGWKSEVDYFLIHGAKVGIYFGFGKFNFGFFCLIHDFPN